MFGFAPLAKIPVSDDSGVVNYNIGIADITSTPTLSVDIDQSHVIPLNQILAGQPVIDTATVSEEETFTIADIVIAPVLDTVIFVEVHTCFADDIVSGAPTIEAIQITELFTANDIVAGVPVVDQITVTEIVNFNANNISAIPVVDSLAFNQDHVLASNDISSGVPTIPVRFLWDFQEPVVKTWTEVSDIVQIWTDVEDQSDAWSAAA